MATNPNALVQRYPTPKGEPQDLPNRLTAQSLQDLNQAIVVLKGQLTAAEADIATLKNRVTALGG